MSNDDQAPTGDLVPIGELLPTMGGRLGLRSRSSVSQRPLLTAETRVPCSQCGQLRGTMALDWRGETRYLLTACDCQEVAAARIAERDARYRQQQLLAELGDTGQKLIEGLELDRFNPRLLANAGATHPYAIATAWLTEILDAGDRGDYHAGPPVALYFYSPGKGRGKTHLAAACFWEARRNHRLAVFLDETSYYERRRSCKMEELERLSTLPGNRAWLTVVDDLGNRRPTEALMDDWYAVFNRRWLRRGWTIITSNKTPDQLVEQRTIDEATYSRLMQMIRKRVIYFDGPDVRLMEVPA